MNTTFTITLLETSERLTVPAESWRDALVQVGRADAVVVTPFSYIENGTECAAFAACCLLSLEPPFPSLTVADSASAALDAVRASFLDACGVAGGSNAK